MGMQHYYLHLVAIVFSAILVFQAKAFTDPLDVTALQDLYKAFNNTTQLPGWKISGGDPCEEGWAGVSCSGSSVIQIQLRGLNLVGYLGNEFHNLLNLKYLDVSFNNILGVIPYGLPPNASHVNLAYNNLSQYIPESLPMMKHLRYLNLSHNMLSGPVGNVFTELQIIEMDLSYNYFTGDLPSSFGSLKNLTTLFLQNNKFTGSVIYLANLPLTNLNIEDNEFSGVIPLQFQYIPNLWIWGNKFQKGANYPLWNFPLDSKPMTKQNITGRPTTQSSAIENIPSVRVVGHKKKRLGAGGIACVVGGVALVVTCAALFIATRINGTCVLTLKSFGGSNSTEHSLPLSASKDCSSSATEGSPPLLAVQSPPTILRPRPPIYSPKLIRTEKTSKRKSFSSKSKFPETAKMYTLQELQLATNSFSVENLLGEGSLGSVYRAELSDDQVLAVKTINMITLSFSEQEQFMDVIRLASRLRHPNIVTLLGCCIEHGQHLLVYEYVRNITLDSALHGEVYTPLSWGLRLHIALGISRALEYLHSSLFPPVVHSNLKAANILLDEELMPRITDCGLAMLRSLTTNSVKLKASEIAIGNTGYIAPEHGQSGEDNMKSDIYAFGVLLLELLTGRRPFESSKRREGRSLVRWASSRLHDRESLEQMVDAKIRNTIPSKSLSHYADIVSLCIQPEKEFRPVMSEVVNSLSCLLKKLDTGKSGAADSNEVDPLDRSFCSTQTQFVGSPATSSMSV